MARSFDDATRRNIAELCAAFTRLHPGEVAPVLKRAAVAIALTRGEGGSGTAFLLTRRAAGLRAHRDGVPVDPPRRGPARPLGAMGIAGWTLRPRRDTGAGCAARTARGARSSARSG